MAASPSTLSTPPGIHPFHEREFAAVTVQELLEPHAELIDRIKLCYGFERERFERELIPLIERYAAFVHLLPATANNYFHSSGGLLRLGLEVAFYSLQGTDARIFSGRSTISVRRELEPRARLATFSAGLCCELHRTLTHMVVCDERGKAWPACLMPLTHWLLDHQVPRYAVRWPLQALEARGAGLFALPHVVGPELLQDLATGNAFLVPHLLASVSGIALPGERNVLDELVRRSLALVIEADLTEKVVQGARVPYGHHWSRYLVDAMRHLVVTHPAWVANDEKSRVWLGRDGLFLLWPQAAMDIDALFRRQQLPGIPTPDTMLDILLDTGVLVASDAAKSWTIQVADGKAGRQAVKVTEPGFLLDGLLPAPAQIDRALATADEPNASSEVVQIRGVDAAPTPPTVLSIHPSTQQPLELRAPLRLNLAVKTAVQEVLQALNAKTEPAIGCLTDQGLFIPIETFMRRGVPSALRSLEEVGMLAAVSGEPAAAARTVSIDFAGQPTVGLVISARFLSGLPMPSTSSSQYPH